MPDFPTTNHDDLLEAIYDAIALGGDLHRSYDDYDLMNGGAVEMDGSFAIGPMVDGAFENGDQPDGADTPGWIMTKGRFTVTALTMRQSPGNARPSTRIANARMGRIKKRLYARFRCVTDDQTQFPGVTDIVYVGGRTAYAYRNSTDWLAVDVTFDILFCLDQDSE